MDLREGDGGIEILSTPDSGVVVTCRRILLPPFEKFCHVAANSENFRWIGASNKMFPWVGSGKLTSIFEERTPEPPAIQAPNKRAFLMLFKLRNGKFLIVMPLSGEDSICWLETKENGDLVLDYGSLGSKPVPANSQVPLLAWSMKANVYEAIAALWQRIIDANVANGNVSLRSQKAYPEPLKRLGWCTWEQYQRDINEKIILDAFDGIEASRIPVRWLLIDDGFQTRLNRFMLSMKPNAKAFPNGWDCILARKREDKVKWIGIWHALLMYWDGIHRQHDMNDFAPYLMDSPKRENVLVPKDNATDSRAFYSKFMSRVKGDGFDFVKIDNMTRSLTEYYGSANPVRAHKNNLRSVERACRENGLGLMNCSAQNTVGVLNAKSSATMRTSPDYRKEFPAHSKSQILQSVFNACWVGQTSWPDHDMFHSSDKAVASTMAVTKAMSGGPVYLSDAPRDFNAEVIRPLCYRDGLLIRPVAPSVPVPESIFCDALYDGSAYKVIAPLNNQACAIAVYNLNLEDGLTVGAAISSHDYTHGSAMLQPYEGPWKIPDEGLVAYDWDKRVCAKLDSGNRDFQIVGFGHKLFLLAPIRLGWAIIGRPDKYLSPATVEIAKIQSDGILIKMREPAPIIIYSERSAPKSERMTFTALDENFYEAAFTKDVNGGVEVRIGS